MEKIDIEDIQVNKCLSVGTRMEMASARSAEVIVNENRKFYKYILAAGAFLVIMGVGQFGMNIVAISLEKEVFVNANGSGPQMMQDRTGKPLTMPTALTSFDPYEGLPLAGPTSWDAIATLNLLSVDGVLQGFKLSGWKLDEDKSEAGAYQLTLLTVSGTTLTYSRSIRPAANSIAPFEWVSLGDNIIRIQHPDGRETLATKNDGRRLNEDRRLNPNPIRQCLHNYPGGQEDELMQHTQIWAQATCKNEQKEICKQFKCPNDQGRCQDLWNIWNLAHTDICTAKMRKECDQPENICHVTQNGAPYEVKGHLAKHWCDRKAKEAATAYNNWSLFQETETWGCQGTNWAGNTRLGLLWKSTALGQVGVHVLDSTAS